MSRRRRSLYFTAGLSPLVIVAVLLWARTPCACMPPETVTRLKLGELGKALQLYEAEHRRLPPVEVGLQALVTPPTGKPYMRAPVLDPWHRQFRYFTPARDGRARWELVSLGPDGLLDSDDDVVRLGGFQPPRSD